MALELAFPTAAHVEGEQATAPTFGDAVYGDGPTRPGTSAHAPPAAFDSSANVAPGLPLWKYGTAVAHPAAPQETAGRSSSLQPL